MGQAARKFEVVDQGSLVPFKVATNEPTNEPLTNLQKWMETDALAALANVSARMIQKALAARRWRGADLMVREVASQFGQGGKVLQVHVDSLKAKLQSFLDLLNQMAADGRLQAWADTLGARSKSRKAGRGIKRP